VSQLPGVSVVGTGHRINLNIPFSGVVRGLVIDVHSPFDKIRGLWVDFAEILEIVQEEFYNRSLQFKCIARAEDIGGWIGQIGRRGRIGNFNDGLGIITRKRHSFFGQFGYRIPVLYRIAPFINPQFYARGVFHDNLQLLFSFFAQ